MWHEARRSLNWGRETRKEEQKKQRKKKQRKGNRMSKEVEVPEGQNKGDRPTRLEVRGRGPTVWSKASEAIDEQRRKGGHPDWHIYANDTGLVLEASVA